MPSNELLTSKDNMYSVFVSSAQGIVPDTVNDVEQVGVHKSSDTGVEMALKSYLMTKGKLIQELTRPSPRQSKKLKGFIPFQKDLLSTQTSKNQ